MITVKDNGIGIPIDMHPFLFDKFTKAGRPGIHGEPSIGLGMSIIKKIIEWHNGSIWFESIEGRVPLFILRYRKIVSSTYRGCFPFFQRESISPIVLIRWLVCKMLPTEKLLMENKVIVAIGSSAGGQRPLFSFFDSTPHDNATYVILRHLPYNYQSQLNLILQNHSKLKVVEAGNDMLIQIDKVYMPAKGMYMTIHNDRLYLKERSIEKLYPNRSIDVFLGSLAKAKGRKSVAIILSGLGSDGSEGAALIKEAGGMVIAQNPRSCEFSSMPLNAIKRGVVDHILRPLEMPKVVLEYVSAMQNSKD